MNTHRPTITISEPPTEIRISEKLKDALGRYPGKTIPPVLTQDSEDYGRCIDWVSGVSIWIETILMRAGFNERLQRLEDRIQSLNNTKTVPDQRPRMIRKPNTIILRETFDGIRDEVAAIINVVAQIEDQPAINAVQAKTTRQHAS